MISDFGRVSGRRDVISFGLVQKIKFWLRYFIVFSCNSFRYTTELGLLAQIQNKNTNRDCRCVVFILLRILLSHIIWHIIGDWLGILPIDWLGEFDNHRRCDHKIFNIRQSARVVWRLTRADWKRLIRTLNARMCKIFAHLISDLIIWHLCEKSIWYSLLRESSRHGD